MKTNHAWILALTLSSTLVASSVLADDQPAPAGAAPAPKTKTDATVKKAPAAAKKALPVASEPEKPAAPLAPGPAVARQGNVNVRGQAAINSEVITKLQRGDHVVVLEEITLKKPKTDEPAKWAKIALPTNAVVWVHNSFIDADTKAVKPNRLNLRSGPGENYSVVGRLEKGAVVKELAVKGDWLKIEPPATAYGFVAAHLLVNEAAEAPALVAKEPATPPVTPAPPTVAPPVAVVPPTEVPATPPPTPPTEPAPAMPVVVTPPPTPAPAAPIEAPAVSAPAPAVPAMPTPALEVPEPKEEQLIKRVISREGIVKRSVSIQAPSFFVLASPYNGKTINYLHSTSTNLPLNDFFEQRIVVTGEEQLDERWANTPVIYVESIEPVK